MRKQCDQASKHIGEQSISFSKAEILQNNYAFVVFFAENARHTPIFFFKYAVGMCARDCLDKITP